ncbi:MAG: 2-succinyl-5-enolpyruvyl-6-hydroxy-3-cyclohexene-1-carboxylic-acid synthase [Gilvibacter sp.]
MSDANPLVGSTKLLSRQLVAVCKAKKVKRIVISPGSRNAPLVIGFTSDPYFECYSIVDERCAAFFALGLSQQLKEPVAVVCTSGSAMLNYYPAVAEAFYSDYPLVVLSADRPEALLEIGDGQTIQQEGVYGKHILFEANCKEGDAYSAFNLEKINDALNTAIEKSGPVHINLPFSEPLYKTTNQIGVSLSLTAPNREIPSDSFSKTELTHWNSANKILVLVGEIPPEAVAQDLLNKLTEDKRVLIMTETTSNVHHPKLVNAIDQLIAPLDQEQLAALKPDILVTLGGMIVSKKIKAFLRTFAPARHWHVGPKRAYDTFFCLERHFKSSTNNWLGSLPMSANEHASDYRDFWLQIRDKRRMAHKTYLKNLPFCDFKAYQAVLKAIPAGKMLQVSNSAAIRYTQLFELDSKLPVFCNRGTSGIDGSSSTAVGAAVGSGKPTVLLTGDLSFFYDSNALWNNYLPNDFRIVLINNQGGGIFRILPGNNNSKAFTTYFETKHRLTAQHYCNMYGFEYAQAADMNDLDAVLSDFYHDNGKPKLLEITTPGHVNDRYLLDYFDFVK